LGYRAKAETGKERSVSDVDYYQKHKLEIQERSREYYQSHKKEIAEYGKKRWREHKEVITATHKIYCQIHKAELAEKAKEYRQIHKEELKEYRQANKAERDSYYQSHKTEKAEYQRKRNLQLKLDALAHYGKDGKPACVRCGYSENINGLQLDHVNGDGAEHRRIHSKPIYNWLAKNNYPDGLQTLCGTCHLIKTVESDNKL
jgi:hypothetical protein